MFNKYRIFPHQRQKCCICYFMTVVLDLDLNYLTLYFDIHLLNMLTMTMCQTMYLKFVLFLGIWQKLKNTD